MDPEDRRATLMHFQSAVRALSLPASDQILLFSGMHAADELALEFDHWRRCVLESDFHLGITQRAAISDLDSELSQMSGPENSELWSDSALYDSSRWETVRLLAKRLIATLDE